MSKLPTHKIFCLVFFARFFSLVVTWHNSYNNYNSASTLTQFVICKCKLTQSHHTFSHSQFTHKQQGKGKRRKKRPIRIGSAADADRRPDPSGRPAEAATTRSGMHINYWRSIHQSRPKIVRACCCGLLQENCVCQMQCDGLKNRALLSGLLFTSLTIKWFTLLLLSVAILSLLIDLSPFFLFLVWVRSVSNPSTGSTIEGMNKIQALQSVCHGKKPSDDHHQSARFF